MAKEFQLFAPQIEKTKNGKPYIKNSKEPLFFSVSHTKTLLFIAFCDVDVGIDAEEISREINLPLLLKKLPSNERTEITDPKEFLRRWTIKESAIKWLGGTLAHDLQKLSFVKNQLLYEEEKLPALITEKFIEGHLVSVCSARDFTSVEPYRV